MGSSNVTVLLCDLSGFDKLSNVVLAVIMGEFDHGHPWSTCTRD